MEWFTWFLPRSDADGLATYPCTPPQPTLPHATRIDCPPQAFGPRPTKPERTVGVAKGQARHSNGNGNDGTKTTPGMRRDRTGMANSKSMTKTKTKTSHFTSEVNSAIKQAGVYKENSKTLTSHEETMDWYLNGDRAEKEKYTGDAMILAKPCMGDSPFSESRYTCMFVCTYICTYVSLYVPSMYCLVGAHMYIPTT